MLQRDIEMTQNTLFTVVRMDHSEREKLSALVEELTTSGEPQLSADKMKQVKKICKSSNEHVEHLYHLVMSQLAEDHAEVRLSALQIATELFSRSHHFRTLLVSNLQQFLELTVETDPEQPLPKPREVARKLKALAIRTVQEWHDAYGQAYKKLALGYHFLKQVKKVDFHDVQARSLAERKREEERQQRLERIYKEKVEQATKEMTESSDEIQQCVTEMENCLRLLTSNATDFSFEDLLPAPANHTQAPDCDGKDGQTRAADHEQPCCSKDLESNCKDEEEEDEESCDDEDGPEEEYFIRNAGLGSHKYTLSLELSKDMGVKENEENEALVSNIRDLHRIISTKLLPAVRSWVQVFTKSGASNELLKKAIDYKKSLEAVLLKHDGLHIDYKHRQRRVMKEGEEDEDESDDFEEVPEKEGFEPHIPDHLRAEYGLDPLPSSSSTSTSSSAPLTQMRPVRATPAMVSCPIPYRKTKTNDEELDPTCAAATLRILQQRLALGQASSSSQSVEACEQTRPDVMGGTVKEEAPVIPFGMDLYYWGQEQPTAGKIVKYSSQHQFWVPNEVEEEVENKELTAQMKSRLITFAGSFQPVQHKCRAPMSNGSLCERQDRFKCPFHGAIIPRDELGQPVNPEDRARLERERMKRQQEQPDWRDVELMREIEAATGEDLGSSKTFGKNKKGKGKKKKYPNLTDLKQSANTSRSRLEKKVFNKSSVKRVTQAMSRIDSRKHEKFANQFNYALK